MMIEEFNPWKERRKRQCYPQNLSLVYIVALQNRRKEKEKRGKGPQRLRAEEK